MTRINLANCYSWVALSLNLAAFNKEEKRWKTNQDLTKFTEFWYALPFWVGKAKVLIKIAIDYKDKNAIRWQKDLTM